jgi:phage gp46-like protein
MSDITTVWIPALGRGDWVLKGSDLQGGNDLTTAVLISLFTDRVANTDDVISDGSNDPRGWWGDAGQQYPIGSRLWLLEREKQTDATAARARDYMAESLKWMLDDGVVARFEIDAQWVAPGRLGASVIAHRQDGSTVAMNFANLWQGIN